MCFLQLTIHVNRIGRAQIVLRLALLTCYGPPFFAILLSADLVPGKALVKNFKSTTVSTAKDQPKRPLDQKNHQEQDQTPEKQHPESVKAKFCTHHFVTPNLPVVE